MKMNIRFCDQIYAKKLNDKSVKQQKENQCIINFLSI